jgi:hypothetical protein
LLSLGRPSYSSYFAGLIHRFGDFVFRARAAIIAERLLL